jgi:hypothetical protein
MTKYLNNYYDYPITDQQAEALRFLRDDFSRAVILATPNLVFDSSLITDDSRFEGASQYWESDDPNLKFGRRIPGATTYTLQDPPDYVEGAQKLTTEKLGEEIRSAGLIISNQSLSALYNTMASAMSAFSDIVEQHIPKKEFTMRGWPVFAPIHGLGRTPLLHIDRTIITGLWYAGRAPAKAYIGEVPEHIWQALSPARENEHQNNIRLKSFTKSTSPHDHIDFPVGSLIITRNNKESGMQDAAMRRIVCIHKSGDIPQYGQAGLIMVPKFID